MRGFSRVHLRISSLITLLMLGAEGFWLEGVVK